MYLEVARHNSFCRLGCLFMGSLDWPADFQSPCSKALGDFGQRSDGTSTLKISELGAFSHHLTSCRTLGRPSDVGEEQNPQVIVHLLITRCHGALVVGRRQMDCTTCSFLTSVRSATFQIRHA